jgi:DNA-binding transcriptional LysR family regulator
LDLGSPAYLKRNDVPQHPRDLLQHAGLCLRGNEEDMTLWHYRTGASKLQSRSAPMPFASRPCSPAMMVRSCETGRWPGAASLCVQWDVAPFIQRGALQRILTKWNFADADVLALVPARHGVSARVTQFVNFLKSSLHPQPPWLRVRK